MALRRVAVALLGASSVALLAGYAAAWWPSVEPRAVGVLFASAIVAQLVAFVLLGARRRDGRFGAAWIAVLALVVVVGGILLVVSLSEGSAANEPFLLGLPRRAALVLYGVGVAPLLVLAGAFARGFAQWAPTDDDLARVRALRPPADV
jgi:heme/copper-type cytochrome/quinol oxidase subunit 4